MRRQLDTALRWLGLAGVAVSAAALLASLGLIAWSVAMRYVLGRPIPWVDELVSYLLVAIVMLAAADALRTGEHISIDILTERLSRRARRASQMLGLVAIVLTASLFVVEGYGLAAFSHMVGLVSNGYLAAPLMVPQGMLAVGGAMLGLAALGLLVRMLLGGPADDGADAAGPDPHHPRRRIE